VTAARKAGVEAFAVHAKTVEEIGGAFATIASRRAGALVVALDPLFIQQERDIARRAIELKLPSIFANREYAEAGGLMAYGQNQVQIYRRVAEYVDRIFRGARPAQLPVEQPTQLELVINATTARVLGIGIPKALATSAEIVE
jgi:putative ABC transport system substrate-binding protein